MLEKFDEKINFGHIFNGPFLLNLCHSKSNKNKVIVHFTLTGLIYFPATFSNAFSCVVKLCTKLQVKILKM